MNLKLNGLLFLLGGLIGGYGVYKLMPKPVPQVITKTDVKTKVVRVVDPSGHTTETIYQESKSEQKPVVHNYAVGLSRKYDFSNQKDLYELSIYRNVAYGFHLGFSVNSANQIGIGILKTF